MTPVPPAGLGRPWSHSDRAVPRLVLKPLQLFLHTEQAGGLLVVIAAIAAIVWANSPWASTYNDLWHTHFTVRLGPFMLEESLRHWVNDALMTWFFFVVGLEIKRELISGELRDRRVALLPALGALGGMFMPALIYVALNTGGRTRGWGIPMATDIAFAIGVLALAGRVPAGATSLLLTLAIVDDIGAIAVIALVYSGGIDLGSLFAAVGLTGLIVALKRIQVRATPVYVILGFGVWIATLQSGIHATIAGVLLGLLTPARPFHRPDVVSSEARKVAEQTTDDLDPPDSDAHLWLYLAGLSRETVSPLARLEATLHPWTSFVVIPIFALANAGVPLNGESIRAAATSRVAWGVFLGLVVGKTVGVAAVSWLGVRLRVARLPTGVTWQHMHGIAAMAGIGFTVAVFITGLAFDDEHTQDIAKTAILAASVVAGILGGVLLRVRRAPATTAELEDRSAATPS